MKKTFKIIGIVLGAIAALFLILFLSNRVNEWRMNKYVDSFSKVEIQNQLEPTVGAEGVAYFVTDGDFKVMHLTDIHIGGGIFSTKKDKMVINAVAAMIDAEKPDLVIVTGDVSFAVPYAAGTLNNAYAHRIFSRLMERLGVFWTVTLGNHDSESYNYHKRDAVSKMYEHEELTHCLYSSADGISGKGNHRIDVRNSAGFVTESFYMIDSHSYTDSDPLGIKWDYDYIKDDQIAWYSDGVASVTAHNAALYASLADEARAEYAALLSPKSLMFMHIPLREVKYAYDDYVNNGRADTEDTVYLGGHDGEDKQVVFSSRTDELLFEAILELGSTKAVFFGHDHLNNFVLSYKGVTLSYGYSMDYLAYFGIKKEGFQRGCAIIKCSPSGDATISHENYYQDKYTPLYEKESVNMSKDAK